jgi:hypothetical protein
VRLGVAHHLLHLVVGQARAALDLDLLLVAGAHVLGRHVDDAVGVDVERDLDLGHAAGRRRDADQLELAERLVVGGHLALALQHVDLDRRLPVLAVEKISAFAWGWWCCGSISLVITPPLVSMPSDSGVTSSSSTSLTSPFSTPAWMAAPMATTSSGLTPRCGSLPISSLTLSCTAGMRVMPPTRITWSICDAEGRRRQRLLGRADGALDQVVRELAQLGAGERGVEVLGAVGVGRDERQVDVGRLRRRQLDLGLLGGLVEPLQRHRVLDRSMPWSRLNSAASQSTTALSKLSPPRWLSPEVAFTSNTPSPSSSTDTSKVPPPRSKTRMVWSCSLSRP